HRPGEGAETDATARQNTARQQPIAAGLELTQPRDINACAAANPQQARLEYVAVAGQPERDLATWGDDAPIQSQLVERREA
ncbi:hypothetical protein, partial [Klebsiella quasipneumoniae]|uniref:hypothetical protein n=1 Tax=Klebsiella quasipneumoniae TaxID=1463165 RepID=UPI00273082CA